MFNFKTFIDFGTDFFFMAITIFFIVLPIVVYKQYRKECDKEKIHHWIPDNFWEYIFDSKASMGFSFVAGIIFFIMIMGFTIYDSTVIISNHYEEPAIYEKYVERGKVIADCIEVSDDIINTELYSTAIAYNTNLAEIKAKYADPRFSMNFTGDYDWNAIPYMDLN